MCVRGVCEGMCEGCVCVCEGANSELSSQCLVACQQKKASDLHI